jgi:adenosine kinase
MDSTTPYWDYLFGNESEALAYSESHSLNTTSIPEIAKHIALLPKANSARPRIVVITQGPDATVVAIANGQDSVQVTEYPTATIEGDEIVDTNGAGDAFAGGFMGKLILGGSVEECVKAGQWLAGLCLRCNGPAYVPFNFLEIDLVILSRRRSVPSRDQKFCLREIEGSD